MKPTILLLCSVCLFVACEKPKSLREQPKEAEKAEDTDRGKRVFLTRHPNATNIGDWNSQLAGKLTIEVQDFILANPNRTYYCDLSLDRGDALMAEMELSIVNSNAKIPRPPPLRFDIHAIGHSLKLTTRTFADDWLEIECSREQADQLIRMRKPKDFSQPCVFVFTLSSASLFRYELSADENDTEKESSAVVRSVRGRHLSGKLVDFFLPQD